MLTAEMSSNANRGRVGPVPMVGGVTGRRPEATVSTPVRLVSSSAIVRKVPS